MPPVGFETKISAGELPQTQALDRAATGTVIITSIFFSPGATTPLGVVFYSPLVGFSLLAYEVSYNIQRRATVCRTPLNEWSARRRDFYLTTHNTHNTNIQALGGIRTHDLSRRAAKDLRLRPRGHWDRQLQILLRSNPTQCAYTGYRKQTYTQNINRDSQN